MAQITVGGTASPGSAPADNPLIVGGSDGANVRTLSVDSTGHAQVSGAGVPGAAIVGNPVLVAGSDSTNTRIIGVNAQQQVLINSEGQKATYTACVLGFTPVATATDFFALPGSATKTIRVTRVAVSGVATAGTIADLVALIRNTANTGGTPSNATVVKHDQNDGPATAQPVSYAANPSPLGALLGAVRNIKLALVTAASNILPMVWTYVPGPLERAIVLRGVAQVFALNWNGAAVPAGTSLDIEITWTEE